MIKTLCDWCECEISGAPVREMDVKRAATCTAGKPLVRFRITLEPEPTDKGNEKKPVDLCRRCFEDLARGGTFHEAPLKSPGEKQEEFNRQVRRLVGTEPGPSPEPWGRRYPDVEWPPRPPFGTPYCPRPGGILY